MVRRIIDASASALRVELSELMGNGRHPRVVLARSIASYLARRMTICSAAQIALLLGRPTHSTVVLQSKRIARMIDAGATVAWADDLLVKDVVNHVRRTVEAACSEDAA